jgi:ATP-dependent Clp protease ATP-binding subunit ClpC
MLLAMPRHGGRPGCPGTSIARQEAPVAAQQPGLSARARWIICTQIAAGSPGRKHTPGIHTRATGFIPFTGPARESVAAAWREARRLGHDHWGPGHLLLALFRAHDQTAAQALSRPGAQESRVRDAVTAVLAGSGGERPA